jgi:hypothetical protein
MVPLGYNASLRFGWLGDASGRAAVKVLCLVLVISDNI